MELLILGFDLVLEDILVKVFSRAAQLSVFSSAKSSQWIGNVSYPTIDGFPAHSESGGYFVRSVIAIDVEYFHWLLCCYRFYGCHVSISLALIKSGWATMRQYLQGTEVQYDSVVVTGLVSYCERDVLLSRSDQDGLIN